MRPKLPTAETDATPPGVRAESRWPVVIAVVIVALLAFFMPSHEQFGHGWIVLGIEVALLLVLIIGDPGAIDRRSRTLRLASVSLVTLLALVSLAGTLHLSYLLIDGDAAGYSGVELLAAGAAFWTANTLTFALVYWELDGGGAAARAHRMSPYPSFAFAEYAHPELVRPGWRPLFTDYLHIAFTTGTAFSPTDVAPLARWSKAVMTAQALLSLSLIGLVVAHAVNVLG